VDCVDKSLGVWSLVGQEPNNSVYLAPIVLFSMAFAKPIAIGVQRKSSARPCIVIRGLVVFRNVLQNRNKVVIWCLYSPAPSDLSSVGTESDSNSISNNNIAFTNHLINHFFKKLVENFRRFSRAPAGHHQDPRPTTKWRKTKEFGVSNAGRARWDIQ
jgi:hypothetical protein